MTTANIEAVSRKTTANIPAVSRKTPDVVPVLVQRLPRLPSRHEMLNQCCFNVVPASKTVAQHWNIGSMSRLCRVCSDWKPYDFRATNSGNKKEKVWNKIVDTRTWRKEAGLSFFAAEWLDQHCENIASMSRPSQVTPADVNLRAGCTENEYNWSLYRMADVD